MTNPDPPAPAPPAPRRWPPWASLLAGLFAGLLLAALVGVPLLYLAYRAGQKRGMEAERQRVLRVEQAVPAPLDGPPPEAQPPPPGGATRSSGGAAERTTAPDAWCFTASECARAVWPMELLPVSPTVDHPHFRVRQGVNRLTGADTGLCEFVFRTDRDTSVIVYLRARYSDDCGNSLRCSIDGGPPTRVGDAKVYDHWLWAHSLRRFQVRAGLHRLTLQNSEDGLEFDRVAVAESLLLDADLDELPVTPAPVFESLPPAAPHLPVLGAVTAQVFASDSLVIGAGHRNTVTLFLRLNGHDAVSGRVELQSPRGAYLEQREFRLTPDARTQQLSWEVHLRPRSGYFVPLQMRVVLPTGCVHQQRLNFIRPLTWAFLGPIPGPEGKGLDFVPPCEARIGEFPFLPSFPGLAWKVVEDGSCYDEFGVVDLNKVFGRPNERWREEVADRPEVAYAVTAIYTPELHHIPLVLAGDDCVQAWHNGERLIRQDGNAPLETSRLVVGAEMREGRNFFVFKVPQTRLYWQLLFEPENTLPYAHPDLFQPAPLEGRP